MERTQRRLAPPWTLATLVALTTLGAVSLRAQAPYVELGAASGEPGEVVEVPLWATYELPAQSFFVAINFDPERLALVGWNAEGTVSEPTDPLARHFNTRFPGEGFVGLQKAGLSSLVFLLPPGERQLIAKVRFLILASAAVGETDVAPVDSVGPARTTFSMRDEQDRLVSGHPDTFVGGSVTVNEPQGPRPVGDLTCEQFLDRVRLTFQPTEAYDSIEIARDGEVVATVAGDATSYEETLVDLGLQTYAVIALRGGERSFPAPCEVIAVSPSAPAVGDLNCTNGRLTWTNPVAFDRITIFRNGEQIAELAGAAQSYTDPDISSELTVYTVISELEGFRSPELNCIDQGIWVTEVGDVQVALGADRVVVPVFLTNPETVKGVGLYLEIDQTRFRLVQTERERNFEDTVSDPEAEIFLTGIGGEFGLPSIGMIYDALPPVEPEKNLPVGLRQRLINFVFEPLGEFVDGERFEISLFEADFTVEGNRSVASDLLIGGEIRFGSAVPPVLELEAEVLEGEGGGGGGAPNPEVGLSWRNGGDYDRIFIERNGTRIGELSGTETEFVDVDVPEGVFTYKVIGVVESATSFPTSTFLSTIEPPGTFKRSDSNRDDRINLADPVGTLQSLFRDGRPLPCEDAADANDDGLINVTDAIFTLNFLFRGGVVIRSPGTAYPWYDPTPDNLGCRE